MIVVNNESGIHRGEEIAVGLFDQLGVGMPAEAGFLLEEMNLIPAAQEVSRCHAGDAGADHSNAAPALYHRWFHHHKCISSGEFSRGMILVWYVRRKPRSSRARPIQLMSFNT